LPTFGKGDCQARQNGTLISQIFFDSREKSAGICVQSAKSAFHRSSALVATQTVDSLREDAHRSTLESNAEHLSTRRSTRPVLPMTAPRQSTHPRKDKTMSDLKALFEKAAADSKNLTERPDNDTLLKLYALFKQGTSGDASGKRPGMMDFVGRAKYDAWAEIKGMAGEDAMQKYVDLVNGLQGK